ncbi:MAG: hypothetical protein Q9226_006827 [Calogaya cf. arnoldii]
MPTPPPDSADKHTLQKWGSEIHNLRCKFEAHVKAVEEARAERTPEQKWRDLMIERSFGLDAGHWVMRFVDDSDSEEEVQSEKEGDSEKGEDSEREAVEDSDTEDWGLTEGDSECSVD